MRRNRRHVLQYAILALLAFGLLLAPGNVAAEEPEWVQQFGGTGDDSVEAITLSPSGLYTVGILNEDAFVRQYHTDGTLAWDLSFGTARRDIAAAVAVDSTGVYIAGSTSGSLVAGHYNPGETDFFVRKYDLRGQELWTRQFGSYRPNYNDYGYDYGRAIAVDATGVYVAGDVDYALPGYEDGDFAWSDAFVRKYTLEGEELWTRQYGASHDDSANALAVDSSAVYVVGSKTYTTPDHAGETDATITAFNREGTQLWSQQFGNSGPDQQRAYGVAADSTGVYVAGGTDNGDEGPFLQKYSLNGTPLWYRSARSEGTWVRGGAYVIALDPTGVYIAGEVTYSFPGHTGPGTAFVQKHTHDGAKVWTRQFGPTYDESARGIAVAPEGIYFGGRTSGAYLGETNDGEDDAVVGKLAHPVGSDPVVATDRTLLLAENGQTVLNTGTYSDPDAGDDVTIRASVGQITKTGTNSGSWEWTYTTADFQDQNVRITVDDGHGGVWGTSFYVAVWKLSAPEQADQGEEFLISAQTSSGASGSSLRYAFDCGGGYGQPGASSTATCTATTYPSQTVRGKVTKDGAVISEQSETVRVVDALAPVPAAPTHGLVTNTALGTSTIPVRLVWSATDAGSGVAKYQLQQRTYTSGAWSSWGWVSQGTTAKSLARQLSPGRYQFRVRAQDKASNWSLWKPGASFTLAPYQESGTASAGKLSYTSTWSVGSSSYYYGGKTRFASAKGATAIFTFASGKQVAWVAPKSANRGYAYVYLDGVKVATVNLYASSAQYRKVVYARGGLNPSVLHTLKVYVTGTRQSGSTGNRVDIDAFVVLR